MSFTLPVSVVSFSVLRYNGLHCYELINIYLETFSELIQVFLLFSKYFFSGIDTTVVNGNGIEMKQPQLELKMSFNIAEYADI